MSLRIPYDTPAEPGWYEGQVRRLKLSQAVYHPKTDPAPKPKKVHPVPQRYLIYDRELEWIKAHCPLIHVPAPGTKSRLEDVRAVRALALGLEKVLRPDEMTSIRGCMFGAKVQNGLGFSEPMFRRYFLDKVFDQEARRQMYLKLDRSLGVEYGGRGEKMRLSDALRGHSGWSRLIWNEMVAPRQVKTAQPVNAEEVETQVEQALEIMDHQTAEQRASLARNILALRRAFIEDYRKRLDELGDYHYGRWPQWFTALVDHFDSSNSAIHPGWFRPGRPVEIFMETIGYPRDTGWPSDGPPGFAEARL